MFKTVAIKAHSLTEIVNGVERKISLAFMGKEDASGVIVKRWFELAYFWPKTSECEELGAFDNEKAAWVAFDNACDFNATWHATESDGTVKHAALVKITNSGKIIRMGGRSSAHSGSILYNNEFRLWRRIIDERHGKSEISRDGGKIYFNKLGL